MEFLHFWGAYKKDAKIEGKADTIKSELQQCCMPSIRSRIFQVEHKSLSTISEDNLLATIKTASVNKRRKTSHRNQFSNIVQSPGESFQSYFARIKAKATLCDFIVNSKCSNNCTKNLDI